MLRTINKMRGQLSQGKSGVYSITTPLGPGLSILLLRGIRVTEDQLLQCLREASNEDEIGAWLRKNADLSTRLTIFGMLQEFSSVRSTLIL
jgi:hypothetical protein